MAKPTTVENAARRFARKKYLKSQGRTAKGKNIAAAKNPAKNPSFDYTPAPATAGKKKKTKKLGTVRTATPVTRPTTAKPRPVTRPAPFATQGTTSSGSGGLAKNPYKKPQEGAKLGGNQQAGYPTAKPRPALGGNPQARNNNPGADKAARKLVNEALGSMKKRMK